MRNMMWKWQNLLTFLVASLVTLLTSNAIPTKSSTRNISQEIASLSELPKVISKVKKVEVSDARVEKRGESNVVALKIKNNSEIGITAFTVTSGDISFGKDGSVGDNPTAVIEPHDTITIDIPLNSLKKDVPLTITGVFYADGSEDGETTTLKVMHGFRAREKDKVREKKGGDNQ